MRCRSIILRVGLIFSISFVPLMTIARAEAAVPDLMIREVKITGDEFIVLQATAEIPNLSTYWVGYASNDTVNPGAIVPSQQLPSYTLLAGQAVLLTSDGAEVCDAVLTTRMSFALADTKGSLVVRSLESTGLTSTFITVDSTSWAKPSASSTTTAQLDLRKEAGLSYPVWYHAPGMTQAWQVGDLHGCTLSLLAEADGTQNTVEWTKTAVEPPAIIEDGVVLQTTEQLDPNANLGLSPPLITELLPNPLGTGNDAADEFIELYNSNKTAFDLSGFTLQTGLSTTHSWVVPNGTVLPAKSFRTFYSKDTGLSMSNTEGQAQLLDINGAVVAKTSPYDSAPDGEAWALANGAWYWTTKSTPAASNIIAKPIAKPAKASKKLTTKKAVKAASTKKRTKKTATETAQDTSGSTLPAAARAALHPVVLATVAIAAIGYGVYEYRHDLANAFHKLRRH